MIQQFLRRLQPFVKPLVALTLAVVLVFGPADSAWAARAGGRIGGGGFRAPSRTYSAPRSYRSPAGGGYYPGGGLGLPFLFPLFGMGGGFGGLFTLLLFLGLANFLVRAVQNAQTGDGEIGAGNPAVTVAQLQIGLLANARSLQDDLNRMALTANTASTEGLTQVLQESSLALLRHPEYWQYATASTTQTRLLTAEQTFNQKALVERSKFTGETLTNVNSQLQQSETKVTLLDAAGVHSEVGPDAYIVATVLVATQGALTLPKVTSTDDVRQALSQLGSVASDRLLAVEILWTPQSSGEALSADELIAEYPNLTLI